MPRSPEANDRIRRATTAQILETALRLFCEKGYYATAIAEIAQQAGISKGLLYHYFASKEEVLGALVDLRIEDILVMMNAAKAKSTPVAQIRHIVEGAFADVRQKPAVFQFYLNLFSQPNLNPLVAKQSQKLRDEQVRQFQVQIRMFEQLGVKNPQERSLYFSATLQGVMLMFSTYPQSFPLDAIEAQVIAEFCQT
jgi:AcrR family transcriptional regulator